MKSQAFSPFLPSYEYIPDVEPHVFGDRLYVYGSHDKFGGNKFCINDYALWSAPVNDLSDWRFEGEIYRKTQDPANRNGKRALWAPDVTRGPDGRYFLYYCLSDYPQISVAVCDTPNGKFEYLGCVCDPDSHVVGQRKTDTLVFDPAVLVDTDGRIWLYAGNGPLKATQDKKRKKASICMELEQDMLTIKTEPKPLIPTIHNSSGTGFEGHEFFEASSIRKFNGRYYFIYSSLLCHELCYAISDWPDRGFIYSGTLISNGDIRPESRVVVDFNMKANRLVRNYIGNNHGSLVQVRNKYYIFFHRHTNRNMFSRQACAEEIFMQEGGRFLQAELTSCGLNGGPLQGRGEYEARMACHLYSKEGALFSAHPLVQNKSHPAFTRDGDDREHNPGQYIENMRDGATAGFKCFCFNEAARITVTIRGKGKGLLVVRDDVNGDTVAKIPIIPCKDWSVACSSLTMANGTYALYFTYEGTGYIDFKSFSLE